MKKLLSNGMILAAGMVAMPTPAINFDWRCSPAQYDGDPRLERLERFFSERECPAKVNSRTFLLVADQHNLDWRLLPSISMVESTGGKAARNNNYFGWQNGAVDFASVDAGIHLIASRLANARPYRNKSLDRVLRTYNPVGDYPRAVRAMMREISPVE